MSGSILVIEDEPNIGEGICEVLEVEGYQAVWISDGERGYRRLCRDQFDLVILDVMLPGMDGYTLCERIRSEGDQTPVLFLSAKGAVSDRIQGLKVGGDDYLPKPFRLEELLLRVQAILRRQPTLHAQSGTPPIRFGRNQFDPTTFRATSWDDETHTLTQREAMILIMLNENANAVVARDDILERVWGHDVFPVLENGR